MEYVGCASDTLVGLGNDPYAAGSAAMISTAGLTPGLATHQVQRQPELTAGAALHIVAADACIPSPSGTVINTPRPPTGPLYVTSQNSNLVTVYATGATGDVVPAVAIEGSNTGLNVPRGIARDAAGNLYVANYGSNAITVFAPGASGNATPIRTIAGASTLLNGLEGIAVDGAGSLYVADQTGSRILVFGAGADGNVAPIRTIAGSCTGLHRPMGLALDGTGNLYAANLGADTPGTNSVTVYAAGASGNATPVSIIAGGNTRLYNPLGIALDAGGSIYVSNYGDTDQGPTILKRPSLSTLRARAAMWHQAGQSRVTWPSPLVSVIDAAGQLYVASFAAQLISIYAPGVTGGGAATGVITGGNTALNQPAYITF